MELSPKQQVTELIRKFHKILLVTHARPDGDALGSLLAVQQVLSALGKEATAVVTDPVPDMLAFMPGTDVLASEVEGGGDFVISLDTTRTPVDKLKYNTSEGKLNIIVSPKQGSFSESDVSFSAAGSAFDLIIVLDAPDLDRIGSFYEQNPDLFYETPVVNIDHHPSNDYFGAVNLVDLTATSTSEILVGVIEALGDSLMTEDVATCLLTGLITDTGSFQNSNTTPKSLTVSAQLVAAGARQQEIIQHVYKTKPLSTLRLWGRALTKLQYDAELKIVWSSLSRADFAETGGTATEAKQVIDALMSSAPDAEIIVLLREDEGKVDGSVRTVKGVDATKIVAQWNGGGHTGAAGFDVAGSLEENESKVIEQIKRWQSERLGRKGQSPPARPVVRQNAPAPVRPAQTPPVQPPPTQSATARPQPPREQTAIDRTARRNQSSAPQQPLTDEELDAYFRKTLGGQSDVVDQPAADPNDDSR